MHGPQHSLCQVAALTAKWPCCCLGPLGRTRKQSPKGQKMLLQEAALNQRTGSSPFPLFSFPPPSETSHWQMRLQGSLGSVVFQLPMKRTEKGGVEAEKQLFTQH